MTVVVSGGGSGGIRKDVVDNPAREPPVTSAIVSTCSYVPAKTPLFTKATNRTARSSNLKHSCSPRSPRANLRRARKGTGGDGGQSVGREGRKPRRDEDGAKGR
mmetsp:Transcript_3791/g.10064  ORF Transcript_3791/g.10064 Transcript_3791/m.10064 type:complete len:104 (-) Transcript_3791:181-492(-)